MYTTPRELVHQTLSFQNTNGRVPRQVWVLRWAEQHCPEYVEKIRKDYPDDLVDSPVAYHTAPKTVGDPYEIGTYIDEWGCVFENAQKGVIGEVKQPLIAPEDENWEDISRIHIPTELLTLDADVVNGFCAQTDRFVMMPGYVRPFERLQFIRGTEALFVDLLDPPQGMLAFMQTMHDFQCRLLETWGKTDVDALVMQDDWGSQRSLLINPELWRELFRPMYRDYIDIAHSYGKKMFMHSDGYILSILPDLVELGLDAINSQIFCIGLDKLAPFAGKITFWGEIDRQQILFSGTKDDARRAVLQVNETLWRQGGCIAQCDFGVGAQGETVYEVLKTWEELHP